MDYGRIGVLIAIGVAGADLARYAYDNYVSTERSNDKRLDSLESSTQKINQFLFGIEGTGAEGHTARTQQEMESIRDQLDRIESGMNSNTKAIEEEAKQRDKDHKQLYAKVESLEDRTEELRKEIERIK